MPMLASVISRFTRSGIWRVAEISELPALDRSASAVGNQLLVLAGGLALTLSRCSADERRRTYPRAAQLYALLRKELRLHGKTSANSALLLEAFHETSEHLDPHSREAFHRCLDARARYERRDATPRSHGADSTQSMFTISPLGEVAQPTQADTAGLSSRSDK